MCGMSCYSFFSLKLSANSEILPLLSSFSLLSEIRGKMVRKFFVGGNWKCVRFLFSTFSLISFYLFIFQRLAVYFILSSENSSVIKSVACMDLSLFDLQNTRPFRNEGNSRRIPCFPLGLSMCYFDPPVTFRFKCADFDI